jgi:catechol 2,3-dioxygenase-like lactoylglutathione lyase family enzyme
VAPNLLGLDHIVLTVRDVEDSVRFYEEVVGM